MFHKEWIEYLKRENKSNFDQIKNYKINNPEVTAFNEEIEDFYMSFDDLLIVYTLQHVIFIILRPIFFIIFMVTSVGHN